MLQKTGYVKNLKQLQKDISERTQKYRAKINDKLNIYHAASKGTKHLCASIVIDSNNQINAIIAYKEKSYFCLKRMAGLLEVLIDLTDSTKQQKPQTQAPEEYICDRSEIHLQEEQTLNFYKHYDCL